MSSKGHVPRCKGVKANGSPCGSWATSGTDYCRHHQDQAPKPEEPIEVLTFEGEMRKDMDALKNQLTHFLGELDKMQKNAMAKQEEESREKLKEEQGMLSEEDLARAKQKALAFAEQEKQRLMYESTQEMKTVLDAHARGSLMNYTPPVSDQIPWGTIGGMVHWWTFVEGTESQYPQELIDLYERRQEALKQRERFKQSLGSSPTRGAAGNIDYNVMEGLLAKNR